MTESRSTSDGDITNSNASNNSAQSTSVVTTRDALRQRLAAVRAAGKSIGLVPTMGALHAGHMSLVAQSRAECGYTVVTIFVNPTQFGPNEDYSRYPRTLEADLALLAAAGADLAFVPDAAEMYPAGDDKLVDPGPIAAPLEGVCRPGHFQGVATIVLKLLNLAGADVAYFGQKDYQQCLVVRNMAKSNHVPTEIRICPIVRESDGLAMSSRNRYLSPDERRSALALSASLRLAQRMLGEGQRSAAVVIEAMRNTLAASGVTRIDYVAIADRETLAPLQTISRKAVALIAAWVGTTRLIDNMLFDNMLLDSDTLPG